MPCVAQHSVPGIDIWCKDAAGWVQLPREPALLDPLIGSAQLHALGSDLYVGVGGSTAGSRSCAVYKFHPDGILAPWSFGTWTRITDDCFGTRQTWVTSMHAFNGRLYIGIAGHEDEAAFIYRTNGEPDPWCGGALLCDVTPDIEPPMKRWQAMAVSKGRLYAGARKIDPPIGWAEVWVTADGTAWSRSSTVAFGDSFNLQTNALVGQGDLLYACTYNPDEGFQVWKRVLPPDVGGCEFVCDLTGCRWVCP
jgi:hypothetical protein